MAAHRARSRPLGVAAPTSRSPTQISVDLRGLTRFAMKPSRLVRGTQGSGTSSRLDRAGESGHGMAAAVARLDACSAAREPAVRSEEEVSRGHQ